MLTDIQVSNRKLGIGGSDIGIILGLSSYKTPYELWAEKSGLIANDFTMTPRQEWGHILEPIIRIQYAKRNNIKLRAPIEHAEYAPLCDLITYDLDSLTHPLYDYMLGNLDGLIPEYDNVLELKCSDAFMAHEWGEDGSDIIPLTYLLQVAHYCSLTNSNGARIFVLIGGNDHREFIYTRDKNIEAKIIDTCKSFWSAVQNGTAPDASCESDLKLMFPTPKPMKQIIINDKIVPYIQNLSDTKLKIKQLTEIENQYKFEIMQYMQDAECLTDANGKSLCTWKATKRGTRTFLLKGM